MAYGRKPRYDDRDDLDDLPARKKRGGNAPLIIGLVAGGVAFLLLTCLCGIGVVGGIAYSQSGTHPDKFVGSWKGRFFLRGQWLDIVYTFDKLGNFREEDFDLQGRRVHVGGGHWRFRHGEVEIEFDNGGLEFADAVFVDNNTINYRIVDHDDQNQVGMQTTFRRQ
jgi:hypothetical protein